MKKNMNMTFLRKLLLHSGAALLCICLSAVTLAHHPVQGKFDPQNQTSLTGVVSYVDWRNPHAHVFVNVADGDEVVNWAVELESPVLLRQSGWDEDSLMPGDAIVVEGPLARNGTRQIWADRLIQSSTGRQVYSVNVSAPALPVHNRPVPRWDDGQPALGTPPGSSVEGYWSFPSEIALVEEGKDVDFDPYGQLLDIEQADDVAPLQPWALALYKRRQARSLQDDPMFLNCKPPGGPRQYQSLLGFQLVEDRDNNRVFVLMGSGNHNYRIIFTEERDQVGLVTGDDDNPLFYGRSVAHWENDTLVVDTTGFNEDFWFSNGGLPHTNQLSMIEKFTRVSADILEYEVTIDDPGAYTRPWTASWNLQWVGGEELPFHMCQHNRP